MSNKPIRILLIEDNPRDVRQIRNVLNEARGVPFELENVDSLFTGLERLAKGGIDLVLLDLTLPDSVGLDAVSRTHAHAPAVSIIVLADYSDETQVITALHMGAQDYLIKGQIGADTLIRAIRYALSRNTIRIELLESENRYRTLVETVHNFVFIADRSGVIQHVNKTGAHEFGYTPKEIIGKNIRDLFPQEEARSALENIQKVFITGESLFSEDKFSFPHREMWLDTWLVPLRDQTGEITAVFGVSQDVTERRHAEDELHKLNKTLQLYANLVRDTGDGVYRYTFDEGKILFANKGFVDILDIDYAPEEIEGKFLKDLFNYTMEPGTVRRSANGQGEIHNFEYHFKTLKGEGRWVIHNSFVRADAQTGVKVVEAIVKDITVRKNAESALRESELRFKELFDNMSNAVSVYEAVEGGRDFIFKDFNKAAEQIERINKKDVLGKSVLEVFPGVKEFGIFDVFQSVWKTGVPQRFPTKLYKDNRIEGWRENYIYKLPSGQIVAVYEDVTERVEREGELKKHRDQLEQLVQERVNEIIKINKQLGQEIEERKKTEERLHVIQSQQEAILNNIPDLAWLKDAESRYIAVNEPFGRSCGLKPEEVVGKTDPDMWPRELAEKYRSDDREVIQSGKRRVIEEPLVNKEGETQFLETIKTPIYNNKGEIIGTAGIARDITDRKCIEEELEKHREHLERLVEERAGELKVSNESLRQEIVEHKHAEEALQRQTRILQEQAELLDLAHDMIIVRDVDDRIVFWNRGAEEAYGWTREEALGKNTHELLKTEFPKPLEDIGVELLQKNYWKGELVHTKRDGTKIIVASRWALQKDENGEPVTILEINNDITERKEAEKVLREKETFLSNIFTSIQDGISILDKNFTILQVNPTMEKWYKHVMPLVGKKCYEAYHGRNGRCEICPTHHTLETGKAAYEIVPKIGPNREIVGLLDLYSFPLIDNVTGQMAGVIEYVRDVTERQQTRNELQKLNKELMKSNKRLSQLSLRDAHTGLYNHRYIGEVLEAEFYRARRYGNSLSVLMIDIDYFKSINELYGHHFGDLILQQLAQQLKKMVRRYDIVARYGGEEFMIVSPGIDRTQALMVGQRLLDALTLYNFGDEKTTVKLKLSIAVVTYPEDRLISGMDLIKFCEQILENAKESGGNRVYSSLDVKKVRTAGAPVKAKRFDMRSLQDKIEGLHKRANESLVESILAFSKTIELKDHYTGEHVERTVEYATSIAKALGLSGHEVELVRQAAMLHDLGKIGISEKILNKKSKLTAKEYEEIKRHPLIAADILRPIHFLNPLIPLILYHHERWDGKGYPTGLKGEDIPLGARIVAIADVYQALTSRRSYRKAFSKEHAIKIIREGAGTQFDPKIVDVFLKILKKEKKD